MIPSFPMENHSNKINLAVARIAGLVKGGKFTKFIDFIEFSNYKNFQKGLRVEFLFPLTVVVGQNGCGKTSLLHALYGAPGGKSPGRWWFGTSLDPIVEELRTSQKRKRRLATEEKAAFWYGYHDVSGVAREVVKMRILKPGDPDYWEPSRPIAAYGMQLNEDKSRDTAIQMQSEYFNLKTQLNAFDRAFYYSEPEELTKKILYLAYWKSLRALGRKSAARIQDFIRYRSEKLRKVLVEGKEISHRSCNQHKQRVALSNEELETISYIIGRKYTHGYILEHRFYGSWGISTYFRTDARSYSEAFAGSGESAVAQMVHEIMSGASNRLLLIDEPETSLHPGAQERLLVFILDQIASKFLQVVISSHSPVFVRHLPEKAIHVLHANIDGKVEHRQNISPDEAFHSIGHPTENVTQIYVEDILAKQMLDAVISAEGEAFSNRFHVSYSPGGTGDMKQDAANLQYHRFAQRVHYVFDGDQALNTKNIELNNIGIDSTCDDIDELIKEQYGSKISFRQNSNMNEDTKREMRINFIKFANTHFHLLPFDTPEAALWDTDTAMVLIKQFATDSDNIPEFEKLKPKERFRAVTTLIQPDFAQTDSREINLIQKMFLNRFVSERGEAFENLQNLIRKISENA
ncbi:ATP-dependent endonuclease [Luteolibacter algae]|uniref:ATP-dependent endonuclease n=1 Tax=Luteolibacter algae TaxID=454151 RepID=A0ABW5D402_9BACT